MGKILKILWTIISYAPLVLVCGIAVLIDSLTTKQIIIHICQIQREKLTNKVIVNIILHSKKINQLLAEGV